MQAAMQPLVNMTAQAVRGFHPAAFTGCQEPESEDASRKERWRVCLKTSHSQASVCPVELPIGMPYSTAQAHAPQPSAVVPSGLERSKGSVASLIVRKFGYAGRTGSGPRADGDARRLISRSRESARRRCLSRGRAIYRLKMLFLALASAAGARRYQAGALPSSAHMASMRLRMPFLHSSMGSPPPLNQSLCETSVSPRPVQMSSDGSQYSAVSTCTTFTCSIL
mmetsp:Transcript_2666/g.5654  ORF Transcript_2666/g.5654 Transcript_2666/m.5654 type:complete len:224 (-) Transcript_2666:698-1369(-)